MATIGSVLISVYAKTDGLRKSLKKAERTIKAFAKKAVKTLKTIGVGLAAGFATAVTAAIVMVNKYSEEIDKLAKTSSKLGISVKSLQKLQYQAELTGLGADKFNKAFNKMVTVIADADNGLSTAARAFDKLGLNIEHIKSLSADQQFYAIAEALKGIKNQTDQIGLAKDIFGAGATGFLNTLNSDLKATGAEFDALGISVTQSGARMVESYNDSKTKMSAIFSGFGLKLTEQLAGPFTKLIEYIIETVKKMGGMEVAAKNFAKFIISGIKSSVSAVQLLIKGFVKLENLMLRIENIKLLPAIAAEAVASQVAGTPGIAGNNTQKAFNNNNQIAKNNAGLKNNSAIDALDGLLKSLEKEIGKKIDMSDVVKPEHYKAFNKAANDANIMADATKKAAENTDKLSSATTKAANAINQTSKSGSKPASNVFNGSFGNSISKGLNPGLSGVSNSSNSSGTVGSIQQYINSSKAGSTMQQLRKGGAFNQSGKSTQKVTIELKTDTGVVAGEIFAEPKFIASLQSFNQKQMNKTARQAAQ